MVSKYYGIRMLIRGLLFENLGDRKTNYKMIFLAGGPGSGKSTLLQELGIADAFTTCNVDDFFEPALAQAGIDPNLDKLDRDFRRLKKEKQKFEEAGEEVPAAFAEEYAKVKAHKKMEGSLFWDSFGKFKEMKKEQCEVGSNFIIDGTAGNKKRILEEKSKYESMGYDCAMIMVELDTEVSIQRNRARGAKGGRQLPDFVVRRSADSVLPNKEAYQQAFGDAFFLVSNLGSFEEFQESINSIAPQLESFLAR